MNTGRAIAAVCSTGFLWVISAYWCAALAAREPASTAAAPGVQEPPQSSTAAVRQGDRPQSLPPVMRFCGPVHCGMLTLHNGQYDAVYDDMKSAGVFSTYKVERFTPKEVRLDRLDKNGFHAVLTGRISPAGNSIVDGQIGGGPYEMTWGTALNTAHKTSFAPSSQNAQAQQGAQVQQEFGLLLLAMGAGASSGGQGDVVDRIRNLEQQRDSAEEECRHNRESPCGRTQRFDTELGIANAELREKEGALQSAYDALSPKCEKHDQAACKQMDELNRQYLDLRSRSLSPL